MTTMNTRSGLFKKVDGFFFCLFLSFYALVKPLDKKGNGAVVAVAFLSTALALYSTLLCHVTLARVALATGKRFAQDVALYYALYAVAALGFAAFYYAYLTKVVAASDLLKANFGAGRTALLALLGLIFYFTSFFVTLVY